MGNRIFNFKKNDFKIKSNRTQRLESRSKRLGSGLAFCLNRSCTVVDNLEKKDQVVNLGEIQSQMVTMTFFRIVDTISSD